MAAFTFKHGDRPLEGYVIQRGVGRGGFGEVYFAVSDGGREVALKYLRDNPAIELRGVSQCMNLKSPHLVTIFDVKKNEQDEYFVIMEYVGGPSLRDLLIAEPNGLGVQKASFFLRELAKGLGYLHERGIVHRDMKPGNIFYEDGYVKIGDYGLSKFISVSRHSAQTASVGTVHYMAPEVGSGSYHRGIDIYALGVILYEMLLGRVPYDGSSMGEVLMKHLTAQPEVDELPAPFPHVIRKALAKDPKDRYQTVDEMAQDVLAAEHVQESLAGFNPVSLTAAARGAFDRAESPVPSPNPLPVTIPYPPRRMAGPTEIGAQLPYERLAEVSPKLARRIERVGAKIDRKLEKLGHKFGRQPAPQHDGLTPAERKRRWFLGLLVVLGFSIALGVVMGFSSTRHAEEAVASGIMGVLAMVTGVLGSRKATGAMGGTAHPRWVKGLVTLGCTAPLIALSMIPAVEGNIHPGVILGLIATAIFVDWEKRMIHGATGELKVGEAFSAGLGALIFTAIVSQGSERALWLAAGIGAATSLAVQGLSWFVPPRGMAGRFQDRQRRAKDRPPPPPPPAGGQPVVRTADRFAAPVEVLRSAGQEPGSSNAGTRFDMSAPREPLMPGRPQTAARSDPRERGGIVRAFWSVVSFGLLSGVIVAALSAGLLENIRVDDRLATLIIMVVCFALLTFAIRKVRLYRQPTFWRNTLRPLLQSGSLTGIGVPIVCLALLGYASDTERRASIEMKSAHMAEAHFDGLLRDAGPGETRATLSREKAIAFASTGLCEDDVERFRHAMNDEEYVACISVLVLSSLLFVVLLFARGRKPVPVNFLTSGAMPESALTAEGAVMAGQPVEVGR